jgi:hypothetical protein
MNQAAKRILCSAIALLFLLTACAPAPVATQDSAVAQLQQTVDSLSTVQNVQATPDPKLDELLQKIDSLVATQNSQPGQDPQLDELKKQVEAIAAQQKALSDALLNPTATPSAGSTLQTPASPVGSTSQTRTGATAPTIIKVEPEQGETYGETKVTITGTNFSADENSMTQFWFGDNLATTVSCSQDKTTCLVVSPRASNEDAESTVYIKAENDGTLSNQDRTFKYLVPPTVESIQPDSGPISGGTVVTITGTRFSTDPTSKTVFKFNDIEARILDCAPPTICRVVSPGIVGENQEIVVWIQAVNSSNDAKSERDTSPDTQQAFKYVAIPKYACGALLQSPKNKTPFKPGASFNIKWIVKNIGTIAWPAGQDVKFSSGSSGNMGTVSIVEIKQSLQPNDTATITIDAKAPQQKGLHYMNWIVAGQGCSLYIAIKVE